MLSARRIPGMDTKALGEARESGSGVGGGGVKLQTRQSIPFSRVDRGWGTDGLEASRRRLVYIQAHL